MTWSMTKLKLHLIILHTALLPSKRKEIYYIQSIQLTLISIVRGLQVCPDAVRHEANLPPVQVLLARPQTSACALPARDGNVESGLGSAKRTPHQELVHVSD